MGCGASATRERYSVDKEEHHSPKKAYAAAANSPTKEQSKAPRSAESLKSYRKKAGGSSASSPQPQAQAPGSEAQAQSPQRVPAEASTATEVEPLQLGQQPLAQQPGQHPGAQHTSHEWWEQHGQWIQNKSVDVLASYNFFFEHIGIRKGWRTPPFGREEVQAPFQAAAEVVVVVRARLDAEKEAEGGGMILRQMEGASQSFLWGWAPDRPPWSTREALEEFFRGLVFATLSDGKGLVEGLDNETVESYVCCHPFISVAATIPSAVETAAAVAAEEVADAEAAANSPPGAVLEEAPGAEAQEVVGA